MNQLAIMAASSGANTVQQQVYVEDVFTVNVRTGTGAAATVQSVGGDAFAVLTKSRSGSTNWQMADTEQGVQKALVTNSTAASVAKANGITAFYTAGFDIGTDTDYNTNGASLVDYVFKEAAKFFDVTSYASVGSGVIVPHSLMDFPGMIISKNLNAAGNWCVWHRGNGTTAYTSGSINSTAALSTTDFSGITTSDFNSFAVVDIGSSFAASGNFVSYLFGHDPSPNGLVKCGTYVGNGSSVGPKVTLDWEPQFLLVKNVSAVSAWTILDEMRGMPVSAGAAKLGMNTSAAETSTTLIKALADGFQPVTTTADVNTNGNTYIYMAIRRQNKPPTSAATVFAPIARTGTGAALTLNTGILTDLFLGRARAGAVPTLWWDRLRGALLSLSSATTAAQSSVAGSVTGFDAQTGVKLGTATPNNAVTQIGYALRRAPQFFDQVVYGGTGADQIVKHALGITPEFAIIKLMGATDGWYVAYPGATPDTFQLALNTTAARSAPTTNAFTASDIALSLPAASSAVNGSAKTFTAYLFGTCAGVSKCGTYTASGTDGQIVDCNFSGGARFVMIKRIDAVGDWYVWDSARGIVTGNDPHIALNTAVAEVTTDDSIDPAATGFAINQVAATNINITGGVYAFLAIA